jgi:hypothetical protein
MKIVRLIWRPRISKKKRAVVLKWVREYYNTVRDRGEYLELKAPDRDTKFIWIFMLSKTFSEIE